MNYPQKTAGIRGFIAILVLILLTYPAFASTMVGRVVSSPIAVSPTFGPAPGTQENVEIAAGPYGYLAVWEDTRGPDVDIFAARISPDGQIIDKYGIAVCTVTGIQCDPAVVWDGTQYIVVWSDRREALQHIYAARVKINGEVLDKQGILVSGTSGVQAYPHIASSGVNCLIVWQDSRGTSLDIYGCVMTRDGILSKNYGIVTVSGSEETPDVAYNGSQYLVVWKDSRNSGTSKTDIYGCRVARNGIRVGSEFIISRTTTGSGAAEDQSAPRICSYGTGCLVVWEDMRVNGINTDVYGARVNASGVVLDANGILISGASGNQEAPSVGFDGTRLLVAWRNRPDRFIKGVRVSTAGIVLDQQEITISSVYANSTGTSTAGYSSKFFTAWSNMAAMDTDVIGTTVSGNGTVVYPSGITVSLAISDQLDYSVADNGTHYAIVWTQKYNGRYCIFGSLLNRDGTLATPNPINITGTYGTGQQQPSITWHSQSQRFLLVWREDAGFGEGDIRGWFLNASLTPLSTSPIPICTADKDQSKPSVTSNASGFFVAWEDMQNAVSPDYFKDIYGAKVSTQGVVTSITICTSANNQLNPKVSTDGSNFIVVWEDSRSYPNCYIYAARISSSGQVLDTNGIKMPGTYNYQSTPCVCFGGSNYLISWSDYNRISACRLTTSGQILDTAGITIENANQYRKNPFLCWSGSEYQIVWDDYRSSLYGNSDVYSATLNQTGQVSNNLRTALISNAYPQINSKVLASDNAGAVFYTEIYNHANCLYAATLSKQEIQELNSVADCKNSQTGSFVAISKKIVSGAFSGFFYVQDENRASGIKVVSDVPVNVGDRLDISGIVSTCDGERQINANSVTYVASGPSPRPWAMRCDSLGGAPLNSQTPGVTGGAGANNIGLLVCTWGKVISTGSGYFEIENKPGYKVRVKSGILTMPAVGKLVRITGISTCELSGGSLFRAILPRTQADIMVIY